MEAIGAIDLASLRERDERVDGGIFDARVRVSSRADARDSCDEAERLLDIVKADGLEMVEGERFFMVSSSWVRKLEDAIKAFRGGRGKSVIVPLDNSDLVQAQYSWGVVMSEDLLEDQFYVVDSQCWNDLVGLFGGGPEIERQAMCDPTGFGGDLDPLGITLRFTTSEELPYYRVGNFARLTPVDQVLEHMCARFGMEKENARLWDCFEGRPSGLLDSDSLLVDAELQPYQLLYLDRRDSAGKWQISDDSARPVDKISRRGSRARSLADVLAADESLENGKDADEGDQGGKGLRFGLGKRKTTTQPGLVGLYNLRNTCYMNSTLQCLSNIPELRRYFVSGDFKGEINKNNPLGTGGKLASAFGVLLGQLWGNKKSALLSKHISPHRFKAALDEFKPDFAGYFQHDAQELMAFMLDGLHEDCNRVKKKPMTEAVEAKGRPDEEVAAEALNVYKLRNDSLIADLFVGMLYSKVVCPRKSCDNVSVTFDPYMMLPLEVDVGQSRSQSLNIVVIPFEHPLRRKHLVVTVPAKGPALHLRNAVAQAAGLATEQFFIAEVKFGKILRLLSDDDQLDSLVSISTPLVVFENPDTAEHLSMLHGNFKRWYRAPLKMTGGRVFFDKNWLQSDPVSKKRGFFGGGGSSPQDSPAVPTNCIRIKDAAEDSDDNSSDGADEDEAKGKGDNVRDTGSWLTIEPEDYVIDKVPSPSSSNGSSSRLRLSKKAPASSKSATETFSTANCPFQKGQLWIGSIERPGYRDSRKALRLEVADIAPFGCVYKVFLLLDINEEPYMHRHEHIEDTKLLIGVYVPEENRLTFDAHRKRYPTSPMSASSPTSASTASPTSASSSPTKSGSPKSRFSPKNMKSRFFGFGRKKGGQANAIGEKASSPPPKSPSTPPRPEFSGSQKPGAHEEKDDDKGGFAPPVAGRVELEASPWKVSNSKHGAVLQRQSGFKISGTMDINRKCFYGKAVWGGGFSAIGNMDFFLRLVPDVQRIQQEEQAPEREAKLKLGDIRAVRYVSMLNSDVGTGKVGSARSLSRKDSYSDKLSDQRLVLDPGILMVDKSYTEAQLLERVHEYFVQMYNSAVSLVDAKKNGLPSKLTVESLAKQVAVVRAGKNYVLEPKDRSDFVTGKELDPGSDDLVFDETLSKLLIRRLVLQWAPDSPVVKLFDLFDCPEDLPLHVGGSNSLRAKDCFDHFCKEEKLSQEDSWYCNKCKQHQEAVKTLRIWSLPAVLVLHLKRFSQETENYTNKVDTPVDFPLDGLDLRKYVMDPATSSKAVYDLCAVSSHYGSLGSGHYTAFARNEQDGKWYEFDDEAVLPVTELASICGRAAYVLFYLRRDLRPTEWGTPVDKLF